MNTNKVQKLESLIRIKQSQVERASQQWADRMDYGHSEREIAAASGRLTQREQEMIKLQRELSIAKAEEAALAVELKRAEFEKVCESVAIVGRKHGFTSSEYLAALASFSRAEAELASCVAALKKTA